MPAGQDAKEGLEEGADRHDHGPRAARGEYGGHTGWWFNRMGAGNGTVFLVNGLKSTTRTGTGPIYRMTKQLVPNLLLTLV